MRLSCIVPATDAPPTLERCLASVRAAEHPPEELIVVTEPNPSGPSGARNEGSQRASGDVLVFVDSDVLVHPDAFARIRAAFDREPELTAVFGSYDDAPEAPGAVSGFRNLLHHHVHQQGEGVASTFWAGLGAIRREAFAASGGFDAERYPMPSIEDVQLGMRLTAEGKLVRLDPALQGTHLKSWSLAQMVRTDYLNRGLPWARLLLTRREAPSSLNLGWRHRLSAVASLAAGVALALRRPRSAALALLALVGLNARFYGLLWRRRGPFQAAAGVGLHALHHLTASASAGAAIAEAVAARPTLFDGGPKPLASTGVGNDGAETATVTIEPGGPRRLLDRAMRPAARWLDADKMAHLGIRNTMRLAKRYNRLLYGRWQRERERIWRDRFEEVADRSGGLSRWPPLRMEDGFALDASGSLPGLEEALEAADEVIAERAGRVPVDDRYRAFFRNLIEVEDLERWPALLAFAATPDVIATVADYLGFVPALSKTLPTGVRVVESGKHLDALAHLPPRDSQVFHIDPYDHPMVYVIVLVRDCTERMGPFTFLPASTSERAARALDYRSRGRPYRLSDEEIYSVVDESERIELTYPRGTVLFIDTSRCFHYGSRDGEEPRFQIMYGLTSVCRSDFSETYMPQFTYPTPPRGGPLQRLVLDRRAVPAGGPGSIAAPQP